VNITIELRSTAGKYLTPALKSTNSVNTTYSTPKSISGRISCQTYPSAEPK
jgi:hypothetical protein